MSNILISEIFSGVELVQVTVVTIDGRIRCIFEGGREFLNNLSTTD